MKKIWDHYEGPVDNENLTIIGVPFILKNNGMTIKINPEIIAVPAFLNYDFLEQQILAFAIL